MIDNSNRPILVIGVGNAIQKDDGVGIHVYRELSKLEFPHEVEVLDGGTLGVDLLPFIEGRKKLIIIDSVNTIHPAGSLFKFAPNDINYEEAPKTSVHQIGLIDSLKMAALVGSAPGEIVIYGVQPKIIDWGEDLSPEVQKVLPKLTDLIIEEIEKSIKELTQMEVK